MDGVDVELENPHHTAGTSDYYSDSVIIVNLITQSRQLYKNQPLETQAFDSFLKKAEFNAINFNHKTQLALVYNEVAHRFRDKSHYEKAIEYSNRALLLAHELNDSVLLATYTNQVAVNYRRISEYSKALDLHLEALVLAEYVKDSFQISIAYNGLGNIYQGLDQHYVAISYYKKSLQLSINQNNLLGQAINNNNIGGVMAELALLDSAMYYYKISLGFNMQIESKVGQAISFRDIGSVYVKKKDFKHALKYLYKGLELNIETGDLYNITSNYTQLAEAYLMINDPQSSIVYAKNGLDIALDIGSKAHIESSYRVLGDAYEKNKNLPQAISHIRLANIYKDSLINEDNIKHIASLASFHNAEKAKDQIELLNNESALQKTLIKEQKKTIRVIRLLAIALLVTIMLVIWQVKLNSKYNQILMQQRLLRSQMNPHFIFNALSAIQVFILDNDMERSSRFLADFARLMRQVLRSSQNEFISLEEEQSTLRYYLELQQLRFSQPFKYRIDIDENLDQDEILMPPMLTQPFVENAIEHGLKSIGEGGDLRVSFIKFNDHLVVEIEDNGIGIESSKKMSGKTDKHESMAIKIANERLAVIKKMTRKKSRLEIIDIQNINPNKKGTLVRIELPIIYIQDKK
ncbi:histidine kinase [bacterium]|nr:histidine kinase [bacterium]